MNKPLFFLTAFLLFICMPRGILSQAQSDLMEKLHAEGKELEKIGKFAEALAKYQESLRIAEESGLKAAVAKNWLAIGYVQVQRGEYAAAMELFQNAKKLAEDINDKPLLALALVRFSDVHSRQSNFQQAKETSQEALKIGEAQNNNEVISKALNGIANVYFHQGDLSQALDAYQRSLKYAEQWGDKIMISYVQANLGLVLGEQGNYKEAIDHHQKALVAAEEAGDRTEWILSRLGITYKRLGLFDKAAEFYSRALRAAEKIGDKQDCAAILNNIGSLYLQQGVYGKASYYMEKSLRLAEELQDRRGIALVLHNLGEVCNAQGQYDKALDYFQKALKEREEIGDKLGIASTLNNIGGIYETQSFYERAAEYYQKSLTLSEQSGDRPRIALALYNIGKASLNQRSFENAEQNFRRCLEISKEINSKGLIGLAYEGLGTNYFELQRYADAAETLRVALAFSEEAGQPDIIWRVRHSLAKTLEKLGNSVEAVSSLKSAIDEIERVRAAAGSEEGKAGFLADKMVVYEDLIRLLYALERQNPDAGYGAEAFAYSERAKARALLDSLAEARAGIRKGLSENELVRERSILRKISRTQSELAKEKVTDVRRHKLFETLREAEGELERFVVELRVNNPEYARLNYPETYSLKQVQDEIDTKTALIEFFLGENESFVFVVTRERFDFVALPKRTDLDQQVTHYRKLITQSPKVSGGEDPLLSFEESRHHARLLFQQLLAPVQETFKRKKKLILVPDGILHYVPFETLETKSGLLIEDYFLSYVPSATVWGNLKSIRKEEAPKRKELLAIADPAFVGESFAESRDGKLGIEPVRGLYEGNGIRFDPLPYSKLEVETISRLYPKNSQTIFLGKSAAESIFKKEKLNIYRKIHFATHAVLDEEVPRRSGIVLSLLEKEEDGILQMQEIFNLDLDADLVVLSACQTGLGKLVRGEGIVSLMRAFFYAGARNVVVSLWSVDDKSTADLMEAFHRHLQAGENYSEALRQTKLEMIRSARSGSTYAAYALPYYWAPFTLIGTGN